MSKQLGPRPNLDHLREQAKDLLSSFRRGEADAVDRFSQGLPSLSGKSREEAAKTALALHDAQSVIAREYDFASWSKLVAFVEEVRSQEGITEEVEKQYLEAICGEDHGRVKRLIELYPGLPGFSVATALASAEPGLVREIDPQQLIGPLNWPPISYVVFSRAHKIYPDRYEAQLECARILLDKGVDPNTEHVWREEPRATISILYGASAESAHPGIVKLLLERGADPNDGESAFHAAEHDYEDILQILLDHGADISGANPTWGNTPVYFLCTNVRETYASGPAAIKGIRWLLEHGADPNVRCGDRQETALHVCCRRNQSRNLLEMLFDHGADPTALDKEGNTPYQLAMASGSRVAVELLRERGVDDELTPVQTFFAACAFNDAPAIHAAVEKDPGIVDRYADAAELLMKQFGELGQVDGLRGLIAAGYPVVGKNQVTPLHDASFPGWLDCVQLLLDHGAPADVLDDEHHSSPLGWATYGSVFQRNPRGNYPEVARLLTAAGAPLEEAKRHLEWTDVPEPVRTAIREALETR